MSESLFVLTGASRGMGAAIAEQLIVPGHTLLCISRGTNEIQRAKAREHGVAFEEWRRDLAQAPQVADELEAWLQRFDPRRFGAAALINNAGVITRVGPVDGCSNAELAAALRVGLESAVLLTASFLRATRSWRALAEGAVKVLNVSSGLGRRPLAGAAPYCAAKAGMDHFCRAAALDEAHRAATLGAGAKIVALAPGVIDTGMQDQLRGADPKAFPDQGNFVDLHASGRLTTPHDAAARVLAYLRRTDFGSTPVADVRDPA